MTTAGTVASLSRHDIETILDVTRALAAPFDLLTMLATVTAAARQVLHAERSSVWLHDAATDELVLEVADDIRHVRVPVGTGLVGACARERAAINVPDCYADPRFDPGVDRRSGYRTRCSLTLPLIGHDGGLVGVMQVLNKEGGVFDAADQTLANALAAQCAVALARVRMTEALLEGEKMRQELELARMVQMSTLPAAMPVVPGYDLCGTFLPAAQTGGDTYDLAGIDQGLLIVLGDATGHGIAPALSVTRMHAMLRMAFRLGADLETAFGEVNDQLESTLPDDRFITAFVGLLDAATHSVRYLSGGQGPILHYRAASGDCVRYRPTGFPLGAMVLPTRRAAAAIDLAPGDLLVLLTDGVFEYFAPDGEAFGEARVEAVLRAHHRESTAELSGHLLDAVRAFARGAPQEDDVTMVLVKRLPGATASRAFPRRLDALAEVVAFTAAALEGADIEADQRRAIDFAIEELFTNMIKYSRTGADPVEIAIECDEAAATVRLVDTDADRFDITAAPEVDTTLPLAQRQPGGLGLHLVHRLVDDLTYEYRESTRESRIGFRVPYRRSA
jgi:sigma-B regulation protein RsbU (phosphoserine phosphatase)